MELRELIQVERAGCHVSGKNTDEDERPTEERIKSQLHRAIFLIGRSEDRDEKIFRNDHDLIEDKEQKQIGAQEDAVRTGDNKQQPEEKFVLPMFHIPREKHCAHRDNARDENHCEANAIDREMIIHPERRYPRRTHDRTEMRKIGNRCSA